MNIHKFLVGCLILGGLAGTSSADQIAYEIGKVGGSELKIALGPRPVAMGEAFVAKADDLNAPSWNPAGLAQLKGYQAGFMHNLYLQDTALEYLAYAQNLFPGAGLGVNVSYLNYGSLDKYNEVNGLPEAAGTFTPGVIMATVGYGQWLAKGLAVGAAAKVYSLNIDGTTYSAVAGDLGAIFQPGVSGLQLGLVLQNFGSALGESTLPQNFKAGAAYLLPVKVSAKDEWSVLADVNVPFGDTNYTSLNVGTEYWYDQLIAGRVGYKVKDTGDLGGITGLTAGLGVKVSVFNVDYALVSFGDLGMIHQVAIAARFE